MIRPATPQDTDALLELAAATGLFEPEQISFLRAMLNAHFDEQKRSDPQNGAFWLTDDDNGPVGVALCEPERMTSGTWNLQLIAVHPDRQGQGRGAALLRHIEEMLAARDQRLLLVDTSGTPDFAGVREFYLKCGYEPEARIRDFYEAGADKVTFRKTLHPTD